MCQFAYIYLRLYMALLGYWLPNNTDGFTLPNNTQLPTQIAVAHQGFCHATPWARAKARHPSKGPLDLLAKAHESKALDGVDEHLFAVHGGQCNGEGGSHKRAPAFSAGKQEVVVAAVPAMKLL